MKINKTELQKALEIVKPGLANKEIIEQSTSFAFINGNVTTYNDEISISHPLTGLKLTGAVKAEELYKLLSKTKGDEIEMEIKDNEIHFTSGKGKAGLTLQAEIKLPLEEIADKEDWQELPDGFAKDVLFVAQACSNDMSRPVLTCVHINPEGHIESSDGFRIIRLEKQIGVEESILIPATAAVEVAKLKPINISLSKGWAHFQSEEGTVLSCRVFDDKYPAVGKLLNVEGIELLLPKAILEIIERAAVFAKRDHFLDEEIQVKIENKKIQIRGESDTGWYEEETNIRYTGDPVVFAITPYLFQEILKVTQTCILGTNHIKFTGDGWQYVAILRNAE